MHIEAFQPQAVAFENRIFLAKGPKTPGPQPAGMCVTCVIGILDDAGYLFNIWGLDVYGPQVLFGS